MIIKIALITLVFLFMGCSKHRIDAPKDLDKSAQELAVNKYADTFSNGKVQNSWLKTFDDNELNRIVKESLKNNPNLKVAAASVEQAKAQTKLAASAMNPSVNYAGRVSQTTTGSDLAIGGVGASWEPDVWGRLSAQVQSASASEKSIQADYAGAKQTLVSDVAKAWFVLIEAQKQERLSKSIMESYRTTFENVKVQFDVGQVLRKDLVQSQAELDSAKDAYIQAQNAHKSSARALEILLGRYPSGTYKTASGLAKLPSFPQVGIPSSLLTRRPDLVAKQEELRAAFFAKKDAELSRLPSFTLSLNSLTSSATGFLTALGAGVVGPIYDGGAISAEVSLANATQKKALMAYQSSILDAFDDVETSLGNEKYLLERKSTLKEAVYNYKIALQDTQVQYNIGKVDITILQVQQAEYASAQRTYLHVRSLLLQNRVNIYLALGGGFDENRAIGEKK